METKKHSFVVYESWYESIHDLEDEVLGKLLRVWFEYHSTGNVKTKIPPTVQMAFKFMKSTFDRDKKKYLETCRKNRANAKQRGAKET
jgi:hypothetical protein